MWLAPKEKEEAAVKFTDSSIMAIWLGIHPAMSLRWRGVDPQERERERERERGRERENEIAPKVRERGRPAEMLLVRGLFGL